MVGAQEVCAHCSLEVISVSRLPGWTQGRCVVEVASGFSLPGCYSSVNQAGTLYISFVFSMALPCVITQQQTSMHARLVCQELTQLVR